MILFQSLTASSGDSHEIGKLPPSPPLSSSGDSGPCALTAGALVLHPVKSNILTTVAVTLSAVQLLVKLYIACKGLTHVERYLEFTNTGLFFGGNSK